jgi:hypothetical protein
VTYTGSKAQAGRGSIISIGSGTPVEIGEISSCSPTGNAVEFVDTSNFDSGVDEEFLPTMRNNGSYRLQGNRVSSDAGQIAVNTAYNTLAIASYTIQYPKRSDQTSTGDKRVFNAFVETIGESIEVKNKITFDVTLKVSGLPVFTPGS